MDDRVMAETGEGKRPDERRRSEPTPWRVEGDRRGSKDDGGRVAGLRLPGGRRFWWFLLALLALNWLVVFLIQGEFEEEVTYPPGEDAETSTSFETVRPSFAEDDLFESLVREDVVVSAERLEQPRSFWLTLILSFGPTLLLVGLFIMLMRRTAAAGAGGIGGLGRSRAKRYEMSERRTTFADVAGIDEAEEQLVEIVDFLKNPDRYRRLGAAIPKGVLLSGPPGTGKTLLARAVAGKADVPFFSLSASEFIEMIVGVGASRVRDLFEQAKKDAPAIIFVD